MAKSIEFRIEEYLQRLNEIFTEKSAGVDFDAVIHGYKDGWKDGVPYDDPVPGAKEALEELRKRGYKIYIHSARFAPDMTLFGQNNTDPEQVQLVKEYLDKHEIPYDGFMPKRAFNVYIDDRAIRVNPLKEPEFSWENALKFC